jgi:hypothetical protein
VQESREEQKVTTAEIDMQNTKIDTQKRTIEVLRALSEKNVRKPTYSQVAQTGTIPPNEARKDTVSSSPKESLVSQSARHDERAVSIGTDRAKFGFSAIKEKLQQGINKVGVLKGLKIQFLRPGPGTCIEVIFDNEIQA